VLETGSASTIRAASRDLIGRNFSGLFLSVLQRHLDKGSDLLEEAGQCGNDPRLSGSSSSSSGLRELARSLKQHLRGFSERLEDTRERLEDTSRCFYLLDKVSELGVVRLKTAVAHLTVCLFLLFQK
jgi:hypothetical protein